MIVYCVDCGKPKVTNNWLSHEYCRTPKQMDGMTFEEIAEKLSISRQRAEQIYAKAIAKMRKTIEMENGK